MKFPKKSAQQSLLSLDNLNASAVLMTSTYACSSNFRVTLLRLWARTANLKADWTSSVPCSKIAPEERCSGDGGS